MKFAMSLMLLVLAFSVESEEKEDFIIIQNSEIIGHVTVAKDQQGTINIDYFVKNTEIYFLVLFPVFKLECVSD